MSTTFIDDRRKPGISAGAILLRGLHVDGALLTGIVAILAVGLAALYSSAGQDGAMLLRQCVRILAAMAAMLIMAQVEPVFLRRAS
ncbi:MAG: hypothetical protein ACN4GT_02330, partial [Gammaproteobacteria bacterium]